MNAHLIRPLPLAALTVFCSLLGPVAPLQATSFEFSTPLQAVQPGESISVPITTANFDSIGSFSFSAAWNATHLQFSQVSNLAPELSATLFNQTQIGTGTLSALWFDLNTPTVSLANGTTLFSLEFTALNPLVPTATTLSFASTPTAIEVIAINPTPTSQAVTTNPATFTLVPEPEFGTLIAAGFVILFAVIRHRRLATGAPQSNP